MAQEPFLTCAICAVIAALIINRTAAGGSSNRTGTENDYDDVMANQSGSFENGSTTVNDTDRAFNCSYIFPSNLEPKLWLMVILLPIVCSFGIVGNTLAILVLLQKRMRGPNTYYLSALAVCDIGILATAMLLYSVEVSYDYFQSLILYEMWIGYLKQLYFFSHAFQVGEVYMTVVATIERFIAIVYANNDTTSRKCCSSRHTLIYISMVAIFSCSFSTLKFMEIEVNEMPWCEGFARWQPDLSDFAKDPYYSVIFTIWITHLFIVFIPFCLLLFLNSYASYRFAVYESYLKNHGANRPIQRKLRTRKSHLNYSIRKSISSAQRRRLRAQRREANLVLLIVVAVFLVCNFPGFLLTLVEHINVSFLIQHQTIYSLSRDVVNLLTAVGASSNFVIYVCFGNEFRSGLRRLCIFCWPCWRPKVHRLLMEHRSTSNGFVESVISSTNKIGTADDKDQRRVSFVVPDANSDADHFLLDLPDEFYDLNQLRKLGLPMATI